MNCCKDCPDRWVDTAAGTTCHSVCARYAAMRAEKDKQYAERGLTWRARRTLRQSGGRGRKGVADDKTFNRRFSVHVLEYRPEEQQRDRAWRNGLGVVRKLPDSERKIQA